LKPAELKVKLEIYLTPVTRLWGRALWGQRMAEATPQGHWQVLTCWGALSTRGLLASMTIEAPTDGAIFVAYRAQVLCPSCARATWC
jgi:hypothetical protein